eukprot:6182190-Pleurochrysis_carterae.AAC.2
MAKNLSLQSTYHGRYDSHAPRIPSFIYEASYVANKLCMACRCMIQKFGICVAAVPGLDLRLQDNSASAAQAGRCRSEMHYCRSAMYLMDLDLADRSFREARGGSPARACTIS